MISNHIVTSTAEKGQQLCVGGGGEGQERRSGESTRLPPCNVARRLQIPASTPYVG